MKDLLKKHRNALTIIIVMFVFCFIIFYGSNTLFVLPFISSVWGNFADWATVLVTFFTASYLVDTFNEQKKINRSNILPIFQISKQPTFSNELNSYCFELKLIINTAYEIKLSSSKIYFIEDRKWFEKSSFLTKNEVLLIICNDISSIELDPNIKEEKMCTFCFTDTSSNNYEQDIYLNALENKLFLKAPKEVN